MLRPLLSCWIFDILASLHVEWRAFLDYTALLNHLQSSCVVEDCVVNRSLECHLTPACDCSARSSYPLSWVLPRQSYVRLERLTAWLPSTCSRRVYWLHPQHWLGSRAFLFSYWKNARWSLEYTVPYPDLWAQVWSVYGIGCIRKLGHHRPRC